MSFLGMRHVAIPVQSIARARKFYCEHFGFYPYYQKDQEKWSMVVKNGTSISFLEVPLSNDQEVPSEGGHYRHFGLCYTSKEEVIELFDALKSSYHCHSLKEHRDKSFGFYMKDTEGNNLEVIFIPSAPYIEESANKVIYTFIQNISLLTKLKNNMPLKNLQAVSHQEAMQLDHEQIILTDSNLEMLHPGLISLKGVEDLSVDIWMNYLVDQISSLKR